MCTAAPPLLWCSTAGLTSGSSQLGGISQAPHVICERPEEAQRRHTGLRLSEASACVTIRVGGKLEQLNIRGCGQPGPVTRWLLKLKQRNGLQDGGSGRSDIAWKITYSVPLVFLHI
ncbi:hypothetical protein ILYODFUR_034007 [Ilyodon furcidens]|uniref:Uncharacterized protein n=1 Tax=Ilyodon furcidens TaxID=33524 RepID=A0ABV0UZA3_9TELE